MAKFAVIGDSTCDLTTEQRQEHNIDYCRMTVSWTDKDKKDHEIHADLDWKEISVHEYYNVLRDGYRIFTQQVTEQEFEEVFRRHLDKGEDILYISCSSGLSASIHAAEKLVKDKLQNEYPDRKFYLVDSLLSAMGQGLMLLKADEMRNAGESVENVAKWIEENRLRFNQVATVETLDYLKRAGRVKASSAFFGNIFGVKPMLISDAKGVNYAVEKAKGRRNALLRAVEMVKEKVENPENQTCYVTHAEASDMDVELIVSKLKAEIPFKEIRIQFLGPIIGASTGPGTFGIYFFGKEELRVGE